MVQPVQIQADAIYDDGSLHDTLGIRPSTLAKARKSGGLRFKRAGNRTLYLGQWLLDWLKRDCEPTPNAESACHA